MTNYDTKRALIQILKTKDCLQTEDFPNHDFDVVSSLVEEGLEAGEFLKTGPKWYIKNYTAVRPRMARIYSISLNKK
ncbi:hypothetical protein SAMN05216175_101292 [Neptunomonas qingdaonensis]|uniref:Uncharacterized protein n=1 Tax=Neptunomonas qingdaonensis TaxID=1045558 RepID=A0A1I2LYJ2_9GAMM|nr:hypothetical protein SAMN05216175_101292 [Neptunomonas qingdaonensis]